MNRKLFMAFGVMALVGVALVVLWYMSTNVKLVTKDERRTIVARELSIALERYYDEHGRYPTASTNEELMQELSAKKYFDTEVRIDAVRYIPKNNGQMYELQ